MLASCGIKNEIYCVFFGIFLLFSTFSCNRLVQVPLPISSVTTNQVYSSDATATAAMLGIYSYMTSNQSWSNFSTSCYLGISADEMTDEASGFEIYDQFLTNDLTAQLNGGQVQGAFWQPAYYDIYSANAVILGVQSSANLSAATKSQLTGEAKFIRAFCYFYLTNIFGDIPLDLTTDFNQTVLLKKSPKGEVYKQIVSDLLDAQNLMIGDFSLSNGMPIRANKWAATALLARIYQYEGQWQSADSAASAVISSGQFGLVPLPQNPANGIPPSDSDVFAANSAESILQLQSVNALPYTTWEGYRFIPYSRPQYWLTAQLINSFEAGDLRWSNWVGSHLFRGNWYYYPYKYKIAYGSPGTASPENYTLLRFAEQYLIRAEAEANLNELGNAINDVNIIRTRAGLDSLPSSLTQPQILDSIQHEYQIEFFMEWGHRWLDIRRWGIAIQTLDTISYKKPNIDSTQLLYPIPLPEIQTDPNLTQNPGYSGN
jgi:hypothetical protein